MTWFTENCPTCGKKWLTRHAYEGDYERVIYRCEYTIRVREKSTRVVTETLCQSDPRRLRKQMRIRNLETAVTAALLEHEASSEELTQLLEHIGNSSHSQERVGIWAAIPTRGRTAADA